MLKTNKHSRLFCLFGYKFSRRFKSDFSTFSTPATQHLTAAQSLLPHIPTRDYHNVTKWRIMYCSRWIFLIEFECSAKYLMSTYVIRTLPHQIPNQDSEQHTGHMTHHHITITIVEYRQTKSREHHTTEQLYAKFPGKIVSTKFRRTEQETKREGAKRRKKTWQQVGKVVLRLQSGLPTVPVQSQGG